MKKMKSFGKKLITLVLMLSLMLSVFGVSGAQAEDAIMIAVAVNQWDAVNLQMRDYFDNYLAKELGIEFIYSEPSGDLSAIIKFVQNAWSSGAVALMDFATQNLGDVEPVAAKCSQLGLYFTTYYQGSEEILSRYDTSVACVASEYLTLDAKFSNEVKLLINDGAPHCMVVLPLAAQYGNVQQLKASVGAIQAFREVYGFELEDNEIEEKVKKSKNNYIKSDVTGSEDVKIGIDSKTDAETLSTLLKNGDYDLVVISGNLYTRFQQPVLEAEQAIGKNIRVVTMTGLEEATEASFNTQDPFGNASLDIALLTPATRGGATVAVMLNAIYGDLDAVQVDGKPVMYAYPLWACHSAEEYEAMGKVDTEEQYYMFTADEIRSMVKHFNAEVTPEFIDARITEYGTFESTRERRGF